MVSRILLGMVLAVAVAGCQAGAAGARAADALLTKSVRYYDGQQWREAWIDEREVVEFVSPGQASPARAAASTAELIVDGRAVRIWRLKEGQAPETLGRSLVSAKKISSVFRPSAQGGARMALSGNIIIRFKPEWSEAQIQSWITAKGFIQANALNGLPSTYVLGIGNGSDALAKANEIHESGDVVYAMPEWWREVSKR